MRILLIGAYGFIGSEIARALIARGDIVTGFGRDIAYGRQILPMVEWRQGDLRDLVTADAWASCLHGIDAVVNASGLLQDEAGHSVATVQSDAIIALIAASAAAGVGRFVQISAANADRAGGSIFLGSKAAADRALADSGLRHVILRPGLVIGRNAYGGSELLRAAAAMPLTGMSFRDAGTIQCVAMADVVDGVTRALDGGIAHGTFDLVEARARTLAEIVASHRAWLGYPAPIWTLRLGLLPLRLVSAVADVLGRFGWRSPLRSNAIAALTHGISGESVGTVAALGRPPLTLEMALAAMPAGKQDRIAARNYLLLPLMLAALFLMWFGSALFTAIGLDAATAILIEGGVGAPVGRFLAGGGALADALLAVMLVHRRTARPALWGMIVVTLSYLAAATVLRPDLWSDPLAPLLKVLPAMLLALVCLTLVERR